MTAVWENFLDIMYIQLGAERRPSGWQDASRRHLRTNSLVGERMTIDGEERPSREPGKRPRETGPAVYRSMRLSQALAGSRKLAQSRMPPAGGRAESAGSGWPFLPRLQELRRRTTWLGESRQGEGMRSGAKICNCHDRRTGSATGAVTAGRRVIAVLGLVVDHAGLLARHLRLGNSGVGSRDSRMLLDVLGLRSRIMNLGLMGRGRWENDRSGNGRRRRHEHGEQNEQPEANEFHASSGH